MFIKPRRILCSKCGAYGVRNGRRTEQREIEKGRWIYLYRNRSENSHATQI